MANRETNVTNFAITTSTSEMLPADLTLEVESRDGFPNAPAILVVEPESPERREVILFDGSFGFASFVTTDVANRYLDGSVASSGITHPVGSVVICAPLSQHIEDLNDRADAIAASVAVRSANVQTASYTLALSDAGKAVEMDAAAANNLTVPPNSSVAFPVGTVVWVTQVGAGPTTIVAGSGVTILARGTLVLGGQWATVALRKRGTDEWVLSGDAAAA